MGLLSFLNRRPSADAAYEHRNQAHPSTVAALPQVRGTTATTHGSGPRTLEEWQRSSTVWNQSRLKPAATEPSGSSPLKPRLIGISGGRPNTAPSDDALDLPQRPKSTGRNPKESLRGPTFTITSHGSERDSRPSTHIVPPTTSHGNRDCPSPASSRRRSSAFVDILDAQGEIKPCDFRSRIQAAGTRDYGEDVADRNMIENGTNLPSPALQPFYPSLAASPIPYRPRGSFSAASGYRSTYVTEIIPEQLEENLASEETENRPASRQISLRGSPRSRRRRLSIAVPLQTSRAMSLDTTALDALEQSRSDSPNYCRAKARSSCGRISVTGSRAPTPQRPPRTSAGPYMRDDSNSLRPGSRSASPPGVPRYKPRQCSLPTDPAPSRPIPGSVRSAREALLTSASRRDRAMSSCQPRCDTPIFSSSNQSQYPQHRPENYYDWSRFSNKNTFGEHLHPSTPTWEDSSSANSENHRTYSLSSRPASRLDDIEKQMPSRTPRRQGSVSSSTPSDRSSPRFNSSRSIRTADTSIDLPHASLFREMKFGDGSSRSIRSRGGDSSIAPDCVGPDEDSCGDSIFISPATPLKEQADPNPLSGGHLDVGFNMGGYESASIYDSDTDSFRAVRKDGEALLFRDKGFGGEGKSLPGLFDDSDSLPTPKWPDMPVTPTEASEMGDDEQSILEQELPLPKPRQNSTKPFTQRERMLALGYDYDSDSDVEASVDQDEIPEERALMLLATLVEASASTPGERQGGQQLDMNTVAKLRREIKKRKRMGPASRRGSRLSHRSSESETVATN